jgi:hypothetical protein
MTFVYDWTGLAPILVNGRVTIVHKSHLHSGQSGTVIRINRVTAMRRGRVVAHTFVWVRLDDGTTTRADHRSVEVPPMEEQGE